MNALSRTRAGRRTLALSAALAGVFAALLGFSAEPALAAYTARVKAGTLTIAGDAASDKLVLRLQPGSPTTLIVDVGADGTADFTFDRGTFTAITVEAGRGDDEVRIDQSAGSFADEAVTLNGGAGADTLLGGSGAETFLGGAGNDVVAGGDGNDRAFLGDGDDSFQWNPGDDNDTIDGQRGTDLLDVFGSSIGESIDVSANAGRLRFFRNIGNVTLDLDDVEGVGFHAAGGADTITVNDLTGTDAKTVDIDLNAIGGGGDAQIDTVTTKGTSGPDVVDVTRSGSQVLVAGLAAQTRIVGGEAANDTLRVETVDGDDDVTVAPDVNDLITPFVDLGTGD
jgi:RTX calcium-binding nonapeptide repeat (4 copies)